MRTSYGGSADKLIVLLSTSGGSAAPETAFWPAVSTECMNKPSHRGTLLFVLVCQAWTSLQVARARLIYRDAEVDTLQGPNDSGPPGSAGAVVGVSEGSSGRESPSLNHILRGLQTRNRRPAGGVTGV
jgi:hypothetical protein